MKNSDLRYMCLPLPEEVLKKKLAGDLPGAMKQLHSHLANPDTPEGMKKRLLAEEELLRLLPAEYPFTREEALAYLREAVPDYTMEELLDLEENGWIDFAYIDGQVKYVDCFRGTLLKTHEEIARRAGKPLKAEPNELDALIREIREQGSAAWRFRVRHEMRLDDAAFVPGEVYRAWLPIPYEAEQQANIRVLTREEGMTIAPADAAQRTVCFEARLTQNRTFAVEYEYESRVAFADTEHPERCPGHLYPKALPPQAEDLAELPPHVCFTPVIRELADRIRGGETNPLEIARRFYQYITGHVRYSFLRAYSQYDDLATWVAVHRKGDCGAQALLFIALCRVSGVPARWQSGLTVEPADGVGSHDWAWFYAEPFGWLPADCSYGGGGTRSDKPERRAFYFGNLDPWRMCANRAYFADFDPPTRFMRPGDPYDSQWGEMECSGRAFTHGELHFKRTLLSEQRL